jgi:hypothetical protein
MRKVNLYIIVFVIVLGGLLNVNAQAAKRSKRVTFDENLVVGGTIVKKGDYDVKFDDQTNNLLIKRGKRVVAQAPASLDVRTKERYSYSTIENSAGQPSALKAVKLGKDLAVIQVNGQEGSNPAPASLTQ